MRTNEKLLRWRLGMKLSQREAAARANLSQPAWQSYEAGRCRPNYDSAEKIQRVTKGRIKIAEWRETDEDRAVRRARAASRRVARAAPPAQHGTGTDG